MFVFANILLFLVFLFLLFLYLYKFKSFYLKILYITNTRPNYLSLSLVYQYISFKRKRSL